MHRSSVGCVTTASAEWCSTPSPTPPRTSTPIRERTRARSKRGATPTTTSAILSGPATLEDAVRTSRTTALAASSARTTRRARVSRRPTRLPTLAARPGQRALRCCTSTTPLPHSRIRASPGRLDSECSHRTSSKVGSWRSGIARAKLGAISMVAGERPKATCASPGPVRRAMRWPSGMRPVTTRR